MARPKCELEGASVILNGSFNPRIFHPRWFAANELLREQEVEVATNENNIQELVMTPELAVFNAGWLSVQVTQSQFLASTSDPASFVPLRDLVLGVFRLLEHTPIMTLALNWQSHYRMPSESDWNGFGDFLVPKKPWEGLIERPGMITLTLNGPKPGASDVLYFVRTEPSMRVKPGVFFEVSAQHMYATPSRPELMQVLEEAWQSTQNHAKTVPERLFDAFYAQRQS